MPGISTYIHIKNNKIFLDGDMVYENHDDVDLKSFSVKAFKHFRIKYPKFYKMDEISRLGFLAAELLLRSTDKEKLSENVGIVLSNAQSTLVTDSTFQQSINNANEFFPSPSVFVYTLPNIMIGEISIRHKFSGENAFFIFDRFNASFIADYINLLFSNKKINSCLGGWVEQSKNDYEAFIYLATNEQNRSTLADHSGKDVRKLFELT